MLLLLRLLAVMRMVVRLWLLVLLLLLLLLLLLGRCRFGRIFRHGYGQTVVVLSDFRHHLYVIVHLDRSRTLDVTAGGYAQPNAKLGRRCGKQLLLELDNVTVQRRATFNRDALIEPDV
uniref:Uncharacterized protein n=1 Tax=Anopheles christyi TaxID=43041 RepID=A0A182KHV8_9DIPT